MSEQDRDTIRGLERQAETHRGTIRDLEEQGEADRDTILGLQRQSAVDRVLIAALEAEGVLDREKIANLEAAPVSARRIGAAIGVLMASEKLTEQQAFDLLRHASQHRQRKLREIAEDVLLTGTLPTT